MTKKGRVDARKEHLLDGTVVLSRDIFQSNLHASEIHSDFSMRRVSRSQPSIWIGASAGVSFSSARLLIQVLTLVLGPQFRFAVLGCPELPESDKACSHCRRVSRAPLGGL